MSKITKAVIGSLYGDEGKGNTVNWLASTTKNPLIVRSNGGAQAAHTVVHDGIRHVFHHFGSATLQNARTHLSRFMICNPIEFNREYETLSSYGFTPKVSVDPDATITTPFEMLINQALELKRGDNRHGSCGLGIGETIERDEKYLKFSVRDIDRITPEFLMKYRSRWIEPRLMFLDLSKNDRMIEHIFNDQIIAKFVEDLAIFRNRFAVRSDETLGDENIIFEGAQGLLLDQNMGYFPHVTRSNTGTKNILELLDLMERTELDIYYISRCYQTRHGAGPLAHEMNMGEFLDIHDPTNIPNQWQGAIRQGMLDFDVLNDIVDQDLSEHWNGRRTKTMVMTCLDQIKNKVPVYLNNRLEYFNTDDFKSFSDVRSYGTAVHDFEQNGQLMPNLLYS